MLATFHRSVASLLSGAIVCLFLGCGSTKVADQKRASTPSPPLEKPASTEPDSAPTVALNPPAGSTDKLSVEALVDRVDDGVALITALDADGEEIGLGTGFVIMPGLIATNYHVIREAEDAKIQLHDGMTYSVLGVRAMDAEADAAILELKDPPDNLLPLTLRTGDETRAGSAVVAIGHPSGFRFSITTGVVSAVHSTADLPSPYREFLAAPPDHLWIQTSAPISPGNSGGPLLDEHGRVIGMNTWVAGGTNLGFALHIRHIAALLERLDPTAISLNQLSEPQQKLKAITENFEKAQMKFLDRPDRAAAALKATAEQFLELAEKNPKSPSSLEALSLIYQLEERHFSFGEESASRLPEEIFRRASIEIAGRHRQDPRLMRLIRGLAMSSNVPARDLLRRIATTEGRPEVQGAAAFALAKSLARHGSPDGRHNAEVEALLTRVTTDFSKVKVDGRLLANLAAPMLSEVKQAVLGRAAPPTTGTDAEGKVFSLSEFAGKVVVLVFWSDEEVDEQASFYTDLRLDAQRNGSEDYVLVGVNTDEPAVGRRAAEKTFCRCFLDGPDGPIAKRWGVEEFPQYFVVDPQGMVRYRTSSPQFTSSAAGEILARQASPRIAEILSLNSEELTDETAPGVIADRIVIWNQHNSRHNERGTKTFSLRLYRHGKEIWQKEGQELPWTANEDTNISLDLPSVRFDRVRVEVDAWHRTSGGLAEIEIFQGERNIARGCPAEASSWYKHHAFVPERINDGITTSETGEVGYWLLPDGTKGWVEIDVSAPTPTEGKSVTADRVVLWNTFNPPNDDRGAKSCTIRLVRAGKEVWSQTEIAIPWVSGRDLNATVELPQQTEFDTLRIEIDAWHGKGGGLSEVQLFRGDQDIARACPIIDRCSIGETFGPARLSDGVTRPREQGIGYWLLPDNTPGWVEIDVSGVGTEIGALRRKLGARHAFFKGDWQRGARWWQRSDEVRLRKLSRREQLRNLGNFDELDLASCWWSMAQQSSAAAKPGILAHALDRYWHAARAHWGEEAQPVLRERIDQALAELPQRNYLFFKRETSVEGIPDPENLRNYCVRADGKRLPFSLIADPPANGSSRIVFRLDRPYQRFEGGVGLDDVSGGSDTPLTFRIQGDGKELWRSKPLKETRDSTTFEVDIRGSKELILIADCPGSNNGASAAWREPRLTE